MKKMVAKKIDSKTKDTTPCRSTRIMKKQQGSPAVHNALASRIKRIEEEKAQSSMHGSGLDKPTATGPDHPEELPALAMPMKAKGVLDLKSGKDTKQIKPEPAQLTRALGTGKRMQTLIEEHMKAVAASKALAKAILAEERFVMAQKPSKTNPKKMFGTAGVGYNSTYNVGWQSEIEPTMSDHIHGTFDSHDKTFMYVANLKTISREMDTQDAGHDEKINQLRSQFGYLMTRVTEMLPKSS
jgi:hypothetical protein